MHVQVVEALPPVILLLAGGIVAAVGSREVGASPIVGYLILGILLHATGTAPSPHMVGQLAELGVVFLLFDIGLHFSIQHLREQARDVFAFGGVQVLLGVIGLALAGLVFGLSPAVSMLIGATLALSSTAVVARLIAERHQQNCPVGMTATSILIFQDIAAIVLLIVATAMGTGEAIGPAVTKALVKGTAAFVAALLIARYLVGPLLDLVARRPNEEVFTALALLVALAAAWVTGSAGLSLTLGAFLGGMILAGTPYRALIQSEVKPFRGLLLSLFFIAVGLSIDLQVLRSNWGAVIFIAGLIIVAKSVLNAMASLLFRWSIPGSIQLGILLAQGSEFAFIILSLPPIAAAIGERNAAILISAVALTIAATPALAGLGRWLAGRLRQGLPPNSLIELQARELAAPVFIVGMDERGRTVADALTEFGINYAAIDDDRARLRAAAADGYHVVFGDYFDLRMWEPLAMYGRRLSVITSPSFERSQGLSPIVRRYFPDLTRVVAVDSPAEAVRFTSIGLVPVVEKHDYPGTELASTVLARLDVPNEQIEAWLSRRCRRSGPLGTTLPSSPVQTAPGLI